MRRWYTRIATPVAALLASLIGASGCERPSTAAPAADARTTIVVWHPWGNDEALGLEKIVARFEEAHPNIRVRLSFASNNLTSSQKLFLAIAGGVGPDVTFVDGQQLSEWAARGALTDLTEPLERMGVGPDDFWLPRWKESNFDGRTYALPWAADPNFAFVWNKGMFRAAGLDPERPPRTIAELDQFNEKLTKIGPGGQIEQIGIVPWGWGGSLSMFSWGYAFGGDFYREPPPGELVGTVTTSDPKLVATLEWIASYAKKYDPRKIASFNSNFVGVANNPFYLGKLAMRHIHATEVKYVRKYAPTIEFGLAPMPAPPGGEYPSGWIGGWSLAVPRGRDVKPEAVQFIRWMCATDEGSVAAATLLESFPAYKKSSYYETIKSDPDRAVFYEILKNSKHVRTLMPVQGYLIQLLDRAVDEVIYNGREPKAALAEVTRRAQERLEGVLKNLERKQDASPAGATVGARLVSPASVETPASADDIAHHPRAGEASLAPTTADRRAAR